MTLLWFQGLFGGIYPLRPFYLYVMCTYYVKSYAIHRHVSIANVTSMNGYVVGDLHVHLYTFQLQFITSLWQHWSPFPLQPLSQCY